MIGLDGTGKATILYQATYGQISHSVPTHVSNVGTLGMHGVSFIIWDIGGQRQFSQP